MKLRCLPILLLLAMPAFGDTFGSGANTFTMDFVTIGNVGNAVDETGYGSVGYWNNTSGFLASSGRSNDGPAVTVNPNGILHPSPGLAQPRVSVMRNNNPERVVNRWWAEIFPTLRNTLGVQFPQGRKTQDCSNPGLG